MSHDKCLNCGFELPDSPREKRYMAGLGSLSNPDNEALVAANNRIAELRADNQRLRDALNAISHDAEDNEIVRIAVNALLGGGENG